MKILLVSIFFFISTGNNYLFINNVPPFLLNASAKKNQNRFEKGRLFDSDEVLQITLEGNINQLMNDRSDDMKQHPVLLSYSDEASKIIFLRVKMKTRGHFRRTMGNCDYPPISIQFIKNDTLSSSIFNEQEKTKLVMPCSGDEYVIREWLVYKLYNLVTPKSFRARLVQITLVDLKSKKRPPPFYGIILEEDDQMAQRNKLSSFEVKITSEKTEKETFLEMAVFQYLIGNTDWSVQYMQNIKLLALDSLSTKYTVPYDFDHAGIVGAPYANPAPELNMTSVYERRYRGYCIKDFKEFDSVIIKYKSMKQSIYDLYGNCSLIDPKQKKRIIKYLDEFYATIENEKSWRNEFSYPCNKSGTGNVVIKGLKDQ